MNNGTIVCKRTLTKGNEVLETVSLSLFPSVHHSSVFAINNQPSTIHSRLRHLPFSNSTLSAARDLSELRVRCSGRAESNGGIACDLVTRLPGRLVEP